MIKIIIRKFIRNHENVTDRKVREAYLVLSGTLGIICNLILFITKLSVGLFINSIAVISDAFNNLTDLGSSLVSILGAKLSNKPPDKDHPYGHGRFEYIASLVVAFIIFSVGIELLTTSYHKVMDPEPVTFNTISLIILILSVFIKLWMFAYNSYIAGRINSSINRAVAYDSLNDGLATSLVIITMIIGTYVSLPIDGAVGIIISLLILYSGFSVAKDTVSLLLGSAPDPDLVDRINQLAGSARHVIGTHDLEVHDYGPSRVIASIHVEVPDTMNIVEVHASIDTLENVIVEELGIDITVHMDPISTDTEKIARVKRDVEECLSQADMQIAIHKFRIAQAENKINVIFDIGIPQQIPPSNRKQLRDSIRSLIQDKHPNYEVVINQIYTLE